MNSDENNQSQLENFQNQFLNDKMSYQNCPFCNRSFFRGKLAYHLKLCSNQSPMVKSLKKSKQHIKNSRSSAKADEKCSKCHSKFPSFLMAKHNCQNQISSLLKIQKQQITEQQQQIPISTRQEQITFPKIRSTNSTEHAKTAKKIIIKIHNEPIKIREQLRCFRIASEVQKVECQFCGRKFSQKASERHIPICSTLKQKQRKEIVYSKDSKSMIFKRQKIKLLALGKSFNVKQPEKILTNKIDLTKSEYTDINPESKIQQELKDNVSFDERKISDLS